jgi:hypothetical protein
MLIQTKGFELEVGSCGIYVRFGRRGAHFTRDAFTHGWAIERHGDGTWIFAGRLCGVIDARPAA